MDPTEKSARAEMLAIIHDQPADATYDEILRQLAFHGMVVRGLADVAADEVSSSEELRRRIAAW